MTTTVKTCFKCKIGKPITEFYVHPRMGDGRLNKCKNCARADVRKNYEDNLEYYRRYDRKRGWRPGDQLKIIARREVKKALLLGILVKADCEMAGEHHGRIEAHHDNYSDPLGVRWLCKKHHGEVYTSQEKAA